MDPDRSPEPSPEGGADADPADKQAPALKEEQSTGFWGRLLGRGPEETLPRDALEHPDALGPAFRNSSPAERAMVMNILRLRELHVEDVMTPRADIVAVPDDATPEEVLAASKHGSYSRMPVYRETLDDPIGFVHVKDLALNGRLSGNGGKAAFKLADHVRTALFVPPSMRIAALLQKMQGERVHMALVIDEFGGVDGLVTIEDLVEQIVGDIADEHDREDAAEWTKEGEGVWLLQARADIREFEEAEGVSLLPEDWEEDVDTMGGLVFMLTNRVPTRGEVIVHPSGFEFEIVDADPRRIKRLRLRLNGGSSAAVRQAAE